MGITLLWIASLLLGGSIVLWGVSLARRDASVVDVAWGAMFVAAALVAVGRGVLSSPWQPVQMGMVAVWGLRLAVHIGVRNRGKGEDRRYAAMRETHGERFGWVSLFTVFLLQGALATLLSAPLVIVHLRPVVRPAWCWIGAALWLAGFFWEAVGDAQLVRFQRDPASRGRVLDTGLWRYSRHPNYFGEALLWWGYGAFALAVPGGFWALFSPLAVTFLLLRVSGVPLLEKGIESRRPGYADYVRRTPSFFPWIPRRAGAAR